MAIVRHTGTNVNASPAADNPRSECMDEES